MDVFGHCIAKVADFGYSIRTAGENNLVKLPFSRLWNCPEWHDRGFRPSEAKKSDAYSFGLLCLWFLFREALPSLAAFLRSRGYWKQAEALKEEVRDLSIDVQGPEHPDTVNSMGNLAVSYRDRKDYKAAEDLQLQVMTLSKKAFGLNHHSTLTSIMNLAATYLDQSRYKEAVKSNPQVMESRASLLDPATLNSKANQAAIFSGQKRWKEAEKLEVEVLDIRRRVLGLEHPDTLTSMANLGATYDSQGRLGKAPKLHREALVLRLKVLGKIMKILNRVSSGYEYCPQHPKA